MSLSTQDHQFMVCALQLARLGVRSAHPNPAVGCVVVKHGQIIGKGWHRKAGEPHAEVNALRDAGKGAEGADVYVTLEPCSHHGKTPPCVNALIEAGVARVVIAMQDPNPLVAGAGIKCLTDAGIEVVSGCQQASALLLNQGFVQRMKTGRPRVVSKLAMSLDGRTALANGESAWISSSQSRQDVHGLRAESSAILTASGTVAADDPQLNVRLAGESVERQPDVVIVDTHLRTVPTASVFKQADRKVIIATLSDDAIKHQALKKVGATIVDMRQGLLEQRIDLACLLSLLADQFEHNQIMVEAGAKLNGSLLAEMLIDELVLYQAPVVLGDEGMGLFHLPALTSMNQRIEFHETSSIRLGKDRKIIYQPTLEA